MRHIVWVVSARMEIQRQSVGLFHFAEFARVNNIGLIDRREIAACMFGLSADFAPAQRNRFARTVRICRGWFTAVATIQLCSIREQLHDHN